MYVPVGCKERYATADGWKNFIYIVESDFADDITVSSISINTTSASMKAGETMQLTATVKPDDATNKSVMWKSDNESVAKVSSSGLVTAVSAGTTTIRCTAQDGSGISATCTVNVSKTYESYNITTTSAGYATFYHSESAYTLPKGLNAQVITGVNGNSLTYETIAYGSVSGIIPKGTAVVLVSDKKNAGSFTLTPSESTVEYSGNNYLHGSDKTATTTASGTNYYYKLTYGNNENKNAVGWYWGNTNGAAFSIDGHKAWLALPKTLTTRSAFGMEDDATGIEDMGIENEADVFYNLQGHRISKPATPGVYIKNGKKVIIK